MLLSSNTHALRWRQKRQGTTRTGTTNTQYRRFTLDRFWTPIETTATIVITLSRIIITVLAIIYSLHINIRCIVIIVLTIIHPRRIFVHPRDVHRNAPHNSTKSTRWYCDRRVLASTLRSAQFRLPKAGQAFPDWPEVLPQLKRSQSRTAE